MKPAPFSYEQISQAQQVSAALLRSDASVKIIAGGQSLGPMLNLRLAQPTHLIDITRLADLKTVQSSSGSVTLGSCITHANIEDGCVPGRVGEILAEIARAIAYRAVRNRGTLGQPGPCRPLCGLDHHTDSTGYAAQCSPGRWPALDEACGCHVRAFRCRAWAR